MSRQAPRLSNAHRARSPPDDDRRGACPTSPDLHRRGPPAKLAGIRGMKTTLLLALALTLGSTLRAQFYGPETDFHDLGQRTFPVEAGLGHSSFPLCRPPTSEQSSDG